MEQLKNLILKQIAEGRISHSDAKAMLKSLQGKQEDKVEDIAVIGMACRFPKSKNINEFWDNLIKGENCIGDFPEERKKDSKDFYMNPYLSKVLMDAEVSDVENLDNSYVKGGYLYEIDKFDADFFRIPPREAKFMDPSQRLFLETAYEAVEDAGYGGKKIYGTRTGVFVGKDNTNFSLYKLITTPDQMHMTGSWTGILATRISYIFDLKGPGMVIDTACSSGLVAIHEACKSINSKECDLAIAGGVSVFVLPVVKGQSNLMGMVESKDGKVKTFDKRADGMVWGEGIGALILKPLNKAIVDGDNIHAVIKGSAVNNDGASNGITAPNAQAQEDLLTRAWESARVNPESLSYIEVHGTGTILGDPIEIKGLINAFRKYTNKKQVCPIGSVKTNIGHLVAASGLASIIKVILSLKHERIPATINFSAPNPYIDFHESPLYVLDKMYNWKSDGTPRRAGINSYGFSGTNCHIVVEEAPSYHRDQSRTNIKTNILALSARNEKILAEMISKFAKYLEAGLETDIGSICFTANTGRGHYTCRVAVVAENLLDLKNKLRNIRKEGLKNYKDRDVYYKEHKIVPETKANRMANEITESEKRILAKDVSEIIGKIIDGEEIDYLSHALCEKYIEGAEVNWDLLYGKQGRIRVSLPTYPFERTRYWAEPKEFECFNKLNIHEGKKKVHNDNKENTKANVSETVLSGRSDHGYTETERKIAYIWAKVLGLKKIDIYDDFYMLGGDSILAIEIANLINKNFGNGINISDLFENHYIQALSAYIDSKSAKFFNGADGKMVTVQTPGDSQDKEVQIFELSHAQKRVWLFQRLHPKSIVYNLPCLLHIQEEIDIEIMKKALASLISRHESLRTVFKEEKGTPWQYIMGDKEEEIAIVDLTGENDKEEALKNAINEMNSQFFDLKDKTFKIKLLKVGDSDYYFNLVFHHIIIDGWGIALFFRELVTVYYAYRDGKLVNCSPISPSYVAWMKRQKEWEQTDEFRNSETYWLDELSGSVPVLDLPVDYQRPEEQSYRGENKIFVIDSLTPKDIKEVCVQCKTTINMMLLSVYFVLLNKMTNQEDIIIGMPITGRDAPDVEKLIGIFINTICIRVNFSKATSLNELIEQVKTKCLNAYKNGKYPFDLLVSKIKQAGAVGRTPIFSTLFHYYEYVPPKNEGVSMFDLSFICREIDNGIEVRIEYCADLFKPETIEKISEDYVKILKVIAENRNIGINEIEFDNRFSENKSIIEEIEFDF